MSNQSFLSSCGRESGPLVLGVQSRKRQKAMNTFPCFRFLPAPTVLVVAVVLLGHGGIDKSLSAQNGGAPEQEWSAPVNLGPVVNSRSNEDLPHLSKNGLSLFFISDRPVGSFGSFDIWVSQRWSLDDPWGPPMNLGPNVNTDSNERGPALSRDGHFLFFSSDRAGFSGQDIWVSYRKHTHDDFGWEAPVKLGAGINTADPEFGAAFLENDDTGIPTLLFVRREGFGGNADIYVSELLADDSFGPGVVITELSTPFDDLRPTIRPNGLELFFASNRPGSLRHDLWVSTRATIFEPWSTPVNAGPIVNTEFNELFPALSSDGATLIFSSDRPNDNARTDLYVSSRDRRH